MDVLLAGKPEGQGPGTLLLDTVSREPLAIKYLHKSPFPPPTPAFSSNFILGKLRALGLKVKMSRPGLAWNCVESPELQNLWYPLYYYLLKVSP